MEKLALRQSAGSLPPRLTSFFGARIRPSDVSVPSASAVVPLASAYLDAGLDS